MRNKRIIAAVATLALGGAVAIGTLEAASAEPVKVSHTVSPQKAGAPAAKVLGVSQALGGLLDSVGKVTAAARTTPPPSQADLNKMLGGVHNAAQLLQRAAAEAAAQHRAAPLPGGADLQKALQQLQKDLTDLVSAITSVNLPKITAALGKVAQDLLSVLSSTVAGLTGGLPNTHR